MPRSSGDVKRCVDSGLMAQSRLGRRLPDQGTALSEEILTKLVDLQELLLADSSS